MMSEPLWARECTYGPPDSRPLQFHVVILSGVVSCEYDLVMPSGDGIAAKVDVAIYVVLLVKSQTLTNDLLANRALCMHSLGIFTSSKGAWLMM